jgi:hypothetical protein
MAPFNPIRRNRNIGTSAQGHGKDNRLVVPRPRHDRVYWESVTSFEREDHTLNGNKLSFFMERIKPGWFYACSIQDILAILRNVPAADLAGMNAILFRQPTRKQAIVNPSWGRLTYHASLGIPGQPDIYSGPLITLEACSNPTVTKWSKSLGPDNRKELDRLRKDGHAVDEKVRYFLITGNEAAVRNTQLYRTLPHEIGHWVDYLEKVERPSENEPERWSEFYDRYFSRPPSEREVFAHRYAGAFLLALEKKGIVPYHPPNR